jgi:hypothetical protein
MDENRKFQKAGAAKDGIEALSPDKLSPENLNKLEGRGWKWSNLAGLWWNSAKAIFSNDPQAQTEIRFDPRFPPYPRANRFPHIRRLREILSRIEKQPERGIIKIVEDTEKNRIQLIFRGKTNGRVQSILAASGFRWIPRFEVWQRHLNNGGKAAAEYAVSKIRKVKNGRDKKVRPL